MGYSMRTGLVSIDLVRLDNVTVAADGRTAIVQVGRRGRKGVQLGHALPQRWNAFPAR
jgi:hypothetical protein